MRNKLKRIISTNDGAAMVLAIGIMAVTVALCLSIMAFGYRNYKASLEERDAVQTKEFAVSAAGMIKKQINGKWYWKSGTGYASKIKNATSNNDKYELVDYLIRSGSGEFTLHGSDDMSYKSEFNNPVTVEFKKTASGSNYKITVTITAKTDVSGYVITDTYELKNSGSEDGYQIWEITFNERT